MLDEAGPGTLSTLLTSWLAAFSAFASVLVFATVGQGLGAMAGGCRWIGISVPIHRQVWALVNQPTLNFASKVGAGGYWLGSLMLPLLAALLLFTLRSRKPTLTGQLFTVQAMWWTAAVAGTWLPLLDPEDGHLSRWLALHRLPETLVWAAPAAAVVVALLAVFRLLEIVRSLRRDTGRGTRVILVLGHLLLPVLAWLAAVTLVGGLPPWPPLAGLGGVATAIIAFSWFRYPAPYPRRPAGLTWRGVSCLAAGMLIAVTVLWWGGRALPGDRVSALLWGGPESFNNIRPWIVPDPGAAVAASDR